MYPLRLAALFLSILLLGCFLTLSPSGGGAMDRPGTIVHALSLPLGSLVYLDAVYVDSVSEDTIVVRE